MNWSRLPGSPRLLVSPTSGRSATTVRSLAGSSDWRRAAIDAASVALLSVIGASRLPTAAGPHWPTPDLARLRTALAVPLPGLVLLGAAVPRQPGRTRLSLVGRAGGGLVVIKLGEPGNGIEREAQVLRLLARDPLPAIATPQVVATGNVDIDGCAVAFLASTALAIGRQRAAIDEPLRTFESDLAQRLRDLPGCPTDDPDGAGIVPLHGDLTPWNLRRTPLGLVLFDWESTGWGPVGSDLADYRRACDEVRRPWNRRRRNR